MQSLLLSQSPPVEIQKANDYFLNDYDINNRLMNIEPREFLNMKTEVVKHKSFAIAPSKEQIDNNKSQF